MLPGIILQVLTLLALSLVVGITATQDMQITAVLAILASVLFSMSNGAFAGKSRYAVPVDGGYIQVPGNHHDCGPGDPLTTGLARR